MSNLYNFLIGGLLGQIIMLFVGLNLKSSYMINSSLHIITILSSLLLIGYIWDKKEGKL